MHISRFLENEHYRPIIPIPLTVKVEQPKRLDDSIVLLVFQKRAVFLRTFRIQENFLNFQEMGVLI